MYILTINEKPIGSPLPLKKIAAQIHSLRHSITHIGYVKVSEPATNDMDDLPYAETHWVYTTEGVSQLLKRNLVDDETLRPGTPINLIGATSCPDEWVLDGWVNEATSSQHRQYLKLLSSQWDRHKMLCS